MTRRPGDILVGVVLLLARAAGQLVTISRAVG